MCAAPSRVMPAFTLHAQDDWICSYHIFGTIAAPDMTIIFRDLWHILSLWKGLYQAKPNSVDLYRNHNDEWQGLWR